MKVRIDGIDYPCRSMMGAMLRYKRETGSDISEMKAGQIVEAVTWIWCCVAASCVADGIEFTLSLQDFADRVSADDFARLMDGLAAEQGGQKKTQGAHQQ